MIISHITFRDCRGPFFSDHLSRNSCIIRDAKNFAPTLPRRIEGGGGGGGVVILVFALIANPYRSFNSARGLFVSGLLVQASFVSGPLILNTSPKCIDQEGLRSNCGLRHRIALIWC